MSSSSSTSTAAVTAQLAATQLSSKAAAVDGTTHSAEDIARHRADWFIPASLSSSRTLNPIRAIVDKVRRTNERAQLGQPDTATELSAGLGVTCSLTRLLDASYILI